MYGDEKLREGRMIFIMVCWFLLYFICVVDRLMMLRFIGFLLLL